MKLTKRGDGVALLTPSRRGAYGGLAVAAGFVGWIILGLEENNLPESVAGGGRMLIVTACLLVLVLYRLLASPIEKLMKPSMRFDKNTGWVTRGKERIARMQEIAAVQSRTIFRQVRFDAKGEEVVDSDTDDLRLSLLMNDGSKVFLLQEGGGLNGDRTVGSLAAFLGVTLRRTGDPWKERAASGPLEGHAD